VIRPAKRSKATRVKGWRFDRALVNLHGHFGCIADGGHLHVFDAATEQRVEP
jgi:hypothetical protein